MTLGPACRCWRIVAILLGTVLAAASGLAQEAGTDGNHPQRSLEQAEQALQRVQDELAAAKVRIAKQSYLHRLALAQRAWQLDNGLRAKELLDECVPEQRHWEWYYLQRLYHGGLLTLPGKSCVAYSPDGKLLAAAGLDKTLRLWDATSGQQVHTLRGQDEVTCVAFRADGKRLASGGNRTIKIREVASGKELMSVPCDANWISAVAFSPDGKALAATSGSNGILRVWNAETGQLDHTIRAHGTQALTLAFSPDGKTIATGGNDGKFPVANSVNLWEAATGKLIRTLQGEDGIITGVAFTPGGKGLASSSWDQTVKVWDLATGCAVVLVRGRREKVDCLAVSSRGGPGLAQED